MNEGRPVHERTQRAGTSWSGCPLIPAGPVGLVSRYTAAAEPDGTGDVATWSGDRSAHTPEVV